MSDALIQEIRERYAYAKSGWQKIRDEGAIDMRFVGGNPWTADDDKARKNRVTVAPEEMGQYFNQVINALMANPRGAKFSPTGNGANDKTARFYQDKWREVEYRSHGAAAYITAATDAIQRSYGFVRVKRDYASPRSANQELWVEAFPDPDVVLPDPDAMRPDSGDMKYCFVLEWTEQREFKRSRKRETTISNFNDFSATAPDWIQGTKILQAEYWTIETRPRLLLLVNPPAPTMAPPQRMVAPAMARPPMPVQMFKDEYDAATHGTVIRELRTVDYPEVKMYLTNGLEILGERHDWPGKFIPIVSCYGKVIYVPEGGQTTRQILSMTRFGRAPWKSYCYACSQELEVLAMVPKAPLMIPRGSMSSTELSAVEESMHQPKAYLLYGTTDIENGKELPEPRRVDYVQAQYLQAIEVVKEGFRRAIQAAMGSNFLPTQAQRRNEKSGVALDKMEQAATKGTYHFVYSYDNMIRRCAEIGEDLMGHVHDYTGDVDTIEADGKAKKVRINDKDHPESVATNTDHVVTISTSPSSDSERDAAENFLEQLLGNLAMIGQIAGPKQAAALLAISIKMRNLGPMGEKLAEIIEPAEYKRKDGEAPPPPELLAAQAQIQQLQQQLQKAGFVIQTKQVEGQAKYEIAKLQEDGDMARAAMDRETKLAIAELGAKVERIALFLEERARVGAHIEGVQDRIHDALEGTKDRVHDRHMARTAVAGAMAQSAQDHGEALASGEQAHGQALDQQAQAAALVPAPGDEGATA